MGVRNGVQKPQLPHPLERVSPKCLFSMASQGFPWDVSCPLGQSSYYLFFVDYLPSCLTSLPSYWCLPHLPNKLLAFDSSMSGTTFGEPLTNTHTEHTHTHRLITISLRKLPLMINVEENLFTVLIPIV